MNLKTNIFIKMIRIPEYKGYKSRERLNKGKILLKESIFSIFILIFVLSVTFL